MVIPLEKMPLNCTSSSINALFVFLSTLTLDLKLSNLPPAGGNKISLHQIHDKIAFIFTLFGDPCNGNIAC